MRVVPMGPLAILVDDLDVQPAALAAAVRQTFEPLVVDVVPGAETVLVTVRRAEAIEAINQRLAGLVVEPAGADARPTVVEIVVVYDGPDLAAVAAATSSTVDEVIALHSGATYHVDFCGFAPGFGYLSGLPPALHLPRRATPRTRVPAGAVAIAASYSAVYPTRSPGGWHLLGTTDAELFDPQRDPPALLSPGTTVRFSAA